MACAYTSYTQIDIVLLYIVRDRRVVMGCSTRTAIIRLLFYCLNDTWMIRYFFKVGMWERSQHTTRHYSQVISYGKHIPGTPSVGTVPGPRTQLFLHFYSCRTCCKHHRMYHIVSYESYLYSYSLQISELLSQTQNAAMRQPRETERERQRERLLG